MSHSCGRYSVDRFLDGKSSTSIKLFHKFSELVRQCGPVKLAPAKTRIGFQVRMIFAAVNKLDQTGMQAHVVLTRKLRNPRFKRVETMSPKFYVHHFKVESMSDFDDELAGWLCEAYEVGTQKHLEKQK